MPTPSKAECLKFMSDSKNAVHDIEHGSWFIGGVEYPEERALLLAEYCLIAGVALTSLATIEAALDIARRLVTAEDRIKSLDKDITDHLLAHGQRKHWWSRG